MICVDASVAGEWLYTDLRQVLEALEPFFVLPTDDIPETARSHLAALSELHEMLWRQERRVTVFGSFKTGKSSLLNALFGGPLLPVRAGRSLNATIVIRYGDQPSAAVVHWGRDEDTFEELPFDEVRRIFAAALRVGEDASEIQIRVPYPLLRGHWVFVDTPGLFEHPAVTERVRREIERSDLAIMVLAADKILSAQERELAQSVHELLNGNLVYVISRLDLVQESEREDVLAWADRALHGSGNRVVGAPRLFPAAMDRDVKALRDWLEGLLTPPLGDQVAALSRLGVLEDRLRIVLASLQTEHELVRRAATQAREAHEQALERERAAIRTDMAEGRVRLQARKEGLPQLGKAFVSACVEDAREAMKGAELRAAIHVPWESALRRYAESVSDDVRDAVLGLPVTAPCFDLGAWIVRAEVAPASHPASEVGTTLGDLMDRVGIAGRETGTSLGNWVAKNVFGMDLEQETLKRVEGLARGMVPSLQEEAQRHIERVDALLVEAGRYFAGWSRTSPAVAAADDLEERYAALVQWSDGFLSKVRVLADELSAS